MSNIYAIYCLLSADHDKKENFIVSENSESVEFPMFKIEHPKLLRNELRYNLQTIIDTKSYSIDYIKNISFSLIDIQNELIIKYLEDRYPKGIDLDNDIFILCANIFEKPVLLNRYEWKKFNFVKSLSDMDIISSIIDFTVEKSII